MIRRLLLDLGNTRLKWQLALGSRLQGVPQALDWPRHDPPWERWRRQAFDEVVIASVAPVESSRGLMAELADRLDKPIRQARTQAEWCGLRCAYAHPERLGVDRWLALIAAWRGDAGGPLIVVSAGTALTIDRLDPGGLHIGGLIAPGLSAMRAGLVAAAPGLATVAPGSAVEEGYATDSGDAITSGCLFALIALIERCRSDSDAAGPLPVWLSGGDAGLFSARLRPGVVVRPVLVLEGLALWAAQRAGGNA